MKRLILTTALAASAFALPAAAQTPPPPSGAPMAGPDGVQTREDAIVEADRRFAELDTNHDGKVTGDEMRAYRDARRAARGMTADAPPPPPPPGADGAAWPPPGDRPHGAWGGRGMNREFTQAEFRDRALRRFDRMDTNHDGRIDPQEREAARMMLRARMSGNPDSPPPPPPADGE